MNGGESDMNHEMNDTVSLLLMVTMFQSVASLLIGIFGYSRIFAVFGVAFLMVGFVMRWAAQFLMISFHWCFIKIEPLM